MKHNNLIRLSKACLGIFAQKLTLIFALSLFTFITSAQDNLWVVGNQLVDFNDPNNTVTTDLPQPNFQPGDAEYPYVYHGETAQYSQNAMWNVDGSLLFFIIDGNIYDGEGYMIADRFGGGCVQCLFPGQNAQQIVTPVPGTCSQYYIINADADNLEVIGNNDQGESIRFSILDMSTDSYYFSNEGRLGGMVNLDDPLFNDFLNQSLIASDVNLGFTDLVLGDGLTFDNDIRLFEAYEATGGNSSYFEAALPYPYVDTDPTRDQGIFVELLDNNLGGDKTLFLAAKGLLSAYSVRSNGVFYENDFDYNSGEFGIDPTNDYNAHLGNLALAESANEFLVATLHPRTATIIYSLDQNLNLLTVTEVDFDSVELPNSISINVISGEFNQNGSLLFLSGTELDFQNNYQPFHAVVETQTGNIQRISDIIPIGPGVEEMSSHMQIQTVNGIESILYATASGASALNGIDNLSTLSFTPAAIQTNSTGVDNTVSIMQDYGIDSFTFFTNQTYKSTAQDIAIGDECCEFRNRTQAYHDMTFSSLTNTITNWSPGDNPFNNTADPVQITDDLVFEQGRYIINDMTFEFAPESNVIIMPGARVTLGETTWTSFTCDGLMWQGVNIIGDTDTPQNLGTAFPDPTRGTLEVYSNSVIENALIGVQVGTNSTNAGGILKGQSSTFRNNRQDVEFRSYQNLNLYLQEYWDLSGFYNCTFITDGPLKNENLFPLYHARLFETYHVDFVNCSFINSTPLSDFGYSNRGYGIVSWNALYKVSGSNQSYDGEGDNNATAFHQLYYGSIILGLNPVQINKMEFSDNFTGVVALSNQITEVSENNFHLPTLDPLWGNGTWVDAFPKSLYFINSSNYTIEENHTYGTENYGADVGFAIVNSGVDENEIYHNHFEDIYTGIYMGMRNMSIDGEDGLQPRCNIFDGGRFDLYLAADASWRDAQGLTNEDINLTNNKFSETQGCETGSDYNDVFMSDDAFSQDVDDLLSHYYCIGDELSKPNCSSEHLAVIVPDPFGNTGWDESLLCAEQLSEYNWPDIPGTNFEGLVLYNEAKEEYLAAKSFYNTTVDQGEKLDLIAEINAAFPLESDYLRDLLLQRYPLSNDVLKQTISRAEPMDPWHLTQVLMANSKLDLEVLRFLESSELLSPFFMSFVYDAQINGTTSLKDLLKQEVSYRSVKKRDALQNLLRYCHFKLAEDQNNQFFLDFLEDQDEDWAKKMLINNAILTNNYSDIPVLISSLSEPDAEYETLIDAQTNMHQGTELNSSQLNSLHTMYNKKEAHYGDALAMLFWLGELTELPEIEILTTKNMSSTSTKKPYLYEKPSWLETYPNPAEKVTFLNYPSEIDGLGKISIKNVLGQEVLSIVPDAKGVLEIDVSDYDAGMYIITIHLGEKQLDELKLIKK